MRIAYFDEAGLASEEQEPFLVVGGLMIHGDREWQPIEHHLEQIIVSRVPAELRRGFVFHATRMFDDHSGFVNLISADERFDILRELVQLIATFKLPVSYGAVIKSTFSKELQHWKAPLRTSKAHEVAFTLCVMGLQAWFTKEAADEVAICIASAVEQKNLPSTLKQNFKTARKLGIVHPATLVNFIDTVHFAAPRESIGLQLADIVAFVIKRYLMKKPHADELYEIIEPWLVPVLPPIYITSQPGFVPK